MNHPYDLDHGGSVGSRHAIPAILNLKDRDKKQSAMISDLTRKLAKATRTIHHQRQQLRSLNGKWEVIRFACRTGRKAQFVGDAAFKIGMLDRQEG